MRNLGVRAGGRRKEQGAILVFVAIALTAVIAAMALSIDGFLMVQSHLEQHDAAEQIAEAALKRYVERVRKDPPRVCTSQPCVKLEREQARDMAVRAVLGKTVVGNRAVPLVDEAAQIKLNADATTDEAAGDLYFGRYGPDPGNPARIIFEPVGPAPGFIDTVNAVRVRLKTRASSSGGSGILVYFRGVIGGTKASMRNSATVYYDQDLDQQFSSAVVPVGTELAPIPYPYRLVEVATP